MKKLCFAFLIVFSTQAFSQLRERGTIEIIPTIGYNTSATGGDLIFISDARSSARFGITGDYYFNDRWSLRSGILYIGMGREDANSALELDYINIPINANWHFGSTRKWNLNFGFTPGVLVRADEDGTDVSDSAESFQLALTYGIGYKLEISKNFSILFDSQAYAGLTKNGRSGILNLEQRNISTSWNIGAVFKL